MTGNKANNITPPSPIQPPAGIRIGSHPSQVVIPAFNIPYLPMMEPVVAALRDTDSFGLIAVARLEWIKFEACSMKAIRDEYERVKDERYTRLHLDHIPVIDEDGLKVDYLSEIQEAIDLGFQSVMVDGSRLSLDENIRATSQVVEIAHPAGVPVEGELGAVFGHEDGPPPPYEELFASGKGFTSPDDARRFVAETKVDWLSVAVGSVHGPLAIGSVKVNARLNLNHLQKIYDAVGIPLVLHGGSGIEKQCVLGATRLGIAKINIGTAIRKPYQETRSISLDAARKAVYDATVAVITGDLELQGSRRLVFPQD